MQTKQFKLNMALYYEDQIVVNKRASSFGRWINSSSDSVTKGVVYIILGDGDFDKTVSFLDNEGTVNEASTKMFELATKKEYSDQFKLLEIKDEPPVNVPVKKKQNIKKKK